MVGDISLRERLGLRGEILLVCGDRSAARFREGRGQRISPAVEVSTGSLRECFGLLLSVVAPYTGTVQGSRQVRRKRRRRSVLSPWPPPPLSFSAGRVAFLFGDRFDLEEAVERTGLDELLEQFGWDHGANAHPAVSADPDFFAGVGSLTEYDFAGVDAVRRAKGVAEAHPVGERTSSEWTRGGCLVARLHREPFRPSHGAVDAVAVSIRTQPFATSIRKNSAVGCLA